MSADLAVIATGGKQYLVRPGDLIRVEKLNAQEGETVTFSEVLMTVQQERVVLGQPTIAGVSVTGIVAKQGRHKKVVGVRFKPKKRQHTKFGHRQHVTEVRIEKIAA